MRSLYTPLALVAVCSVAVLAKSPFRPDDGSGSEYTPTPVALSDPVETTASLDPYETTATLSEDSPAPYAEETLVPVDSVDPYEATTPVAQDASAPYSEETPAPLIEETSAPIALADAYETPAPVAQETSAAYAEETPAPLAQDAYAPAVEETPAPIAQEETPAPIAEEETPAPVAEETLASDASSYRRALRRQRQAVITTTARPGSNASEESGKDASTCTASASCFHDDDCGSTGEKKGRCIGIFNGKCNCNACLNFLTCSDDSACGGLKGACNITTSRCSCDEGYKANGFAGGFLDAFRELCNVKDCNANNHAEQCFGLPCNSGLCVC